MQTTPITPDDLRRSVLAVPPLARNADYSINHAENLKLIRYLEAGGVTTLMYGGNANFYNVSIAEYPALLDFLAQAVAPGTLVIPSVGPDFGKMMDQAPILRARTFPSAMVLPAAPPCTPDGIETGIRRFADAFGRPIVLYVKSEGYLTRHTARGRRRLVWHQVRDRAAEPGRGCIPLATRRYGRPQAHHQRDRRTAGDRAPARLLVDQLRPARSASGRRLASFARSTESQAVPPRRGATRSICRSKTCAMRLPSRSCTKRSRSRRSPI